jgi:hypothetical protein
MDVKEMEARITKRNGIGCGQEWDRMRRRDTGATWDRKWAIAIRTGTGANCGTRSSTWLEGLSEHD